MKKYSLVILICLAVINSACEDFLSEPPSKTSSIVPSKVEHLENLLNRYGVFYKEYNEHLIYASDDYGLLTSIYDNANGIYTPIRAHYATWEIENVANDNGAAWKTEWNKIFYANMILESLEDVEGTPSEKESIKAEVHFVRSYSYFQLVNTFCLPYSNENSSELGLPIKESTSYEESGKRVTLQETWDFILSDLDASLKLNKDLELVDGKFRSWRASTPAIKAFAARVYLTIGDYVKAQSFAEEALSSHHEMMDYNSDMRFSDIISEENVDGQMKRVWYPYTHDKPTEKNRLEWKGLYYLRFLENEGWFYIPSPDLLALYNHQYDLRYKYHIVEDFSYDRGMTISYPGYIFFHNSGIPSGPTVGEMLLVKAECQARTGNWNEALATVNQLREKRMDNMAPANVIHLSASNQAEALTKILEERRRELPFTQRFFDVRRFNNNNDPTDDVVMTRSFYPVGASVVETSKGAITYTLDAKSRKFARPIPVTDINATEGVLEQNTY